MHSHTVPVDPEPEAPWWHSMWVRLALPVAGITCFATIAAFQIVEPKLPTSSSVISWEQASKMMESDDAVERRMGAARIHHLADSALQRLAEERQDENERNRRLAESILQSIEERARELR